MKNIKWISVLSCSAVFLLAVAIITLNITFSIGEEEVFNVLLSSDEKNVIINDNRIDFYHTLDIGETHTFELDIINNGDIDLEILKAIRSDLNDYKIGTSENTGKTYYLSDYINFNIVYLEDNNTNGIKANDRVQAFDYIKSNTTNKVRVETKFKKEGLNADKLEVLHMYSGSEKLDISLYLQLNYKEL